MVSQTQKRLLLVLLGFCLTLWMAACGSFSSQIASQQNLNRNSADCRTVQHDAGNTEICGTPQTIAVVGPNALDLLLSLNEQPAAYADVFVTHSGKLFDNPRQQIPYLGDRITTQPVNLGNRNQPSLEALYALQPDLILGELGNGEAIYGTLSQIAPTVLWNNRNNREKWRTVIRQIAQALGDQQRAEAAIAAHDQRVAQARETFAPITAAHPQVLLLAANDITDSLAVVGSDSYLGELLEGLGFQFALTSEQSRSVDISVEVLPTLAEADTIFVLGHDLSAGDEAQKNSGEPVLDRALDRQTSTAQKSWQENAIAQSLPASQQNRVFFTTYYLWNGLNGPIGAELVIEQLRQFLL
ncbi:iron-siderophore ABC transporter substrate-binding protein [Nodosilinea sp. LEGE 06152]|uniref:ABC transporter substrate-binding protein n=1 Tax=Nodosilinea sp. LEGE 06152 TaxID=2777966 RepID=UPI00188138EE|nr:iron-siderophore ABC transporter substrate-binding protein [Nodosilinea sp. LEGE 06152]MBE9160698.1 iron-siderophore ABC transporter substrate-binding protein [Nodosilinea sp. LEGE 06152]